MQKEFWLERWERQETGFHEGVVNAYLARYWQALKLAGNEPVFVPLCGKSMDMQWLRAQGHTVVAVELSELAARAFFRENGYVPNCSRSGKFTCYEANGIRILCGDFFDLQSADLAGVKAVYDRASMVALPAEMRQRYARHLLGILPGASKVLLIGFDYPQQEMPGPPFALASAEVRALYREHADILELATVDVLPQNPRFQKRGLTRLAENIYQLTLR